MYIRTTFVILNFPFLCFYVHCNGSRDSEIHWHMHAYANFTDSWHTTFLEANHRQWTDKKYSRQFLHFNDNAKTTSDSSAFLSNVSCTSTPRLHGFDPESGCQNTLITSECAKPSNVKILGLTASKVGVSKSRTHLR